ncbi:hypothetical protein NKH18_20370 [Streptomyces sp. M10(2022)]
MDESRRRTLRVGGARRDRTARRFPCAGSPCSSSSAPAPASPCCTHSPACSGPRPGSKRWHWPRRPVSVAVLVATSLFLAEAFSARAFLVSLAAFTTVAAVFPGLPLPAATRAPPEEPGRSGEAPMTARQGPGRAPRRGRAGPVRI